MHKNSNQIPVINSLRGFAALTICLYHFVVTIKGYITNETLLDLFYFGRKGVQLFFIISGVVITLSMVRSNYRINLFTNYLLRRLIRIQPPYLVAIILSMFYLYARNFVTTSADVNLFPTIRDTFLNSTYLVPFIEGVEWVNPVFWTLSVEFQYYIFLAICLPLALSNKTILKWGFNSLILIVPFLVSSSGYFFNWSAYFGIGIFYTLYITKTYTFKEFVVLILLCSVVIYFKQGLIDLAIAFGALSIIHFLPKHSSRIGAFFGKISYSLYLVHLIIGAGFINFMSHRILSPIGKFLVISTGLFISILSAYVLWRLVERPSQNQSQKLRTDNN
ncbi:MAG: peptidoglycan/LPS O-acetylase OafA/YrhL [Glaciecola sp.]